VGLKGLAVLLSSLGLCPDPTGLGTWTLMWVQDLLLTVHVLSRAGLRHRPTRPWPGPRRFWVAKKLRCIFAHDDSIICRMMYNTATQTIIYLFLLKFGMMVARWMVYRTARCMCNGGPTIYLGPRAHQSLNPALVLSTIDNLQQVDSREDSVPLLTLLPASTRMSMMSSRSDSTAKWSAVTPLTPLVVIVAWTSAPESTSNLTTAVWPFLTATCSGVTDRLPSISATQRTLQLASISRLMTSAWPRCEARHSGVTAQGPRMSGSAPDLSRTEHSSV